MNIYFHRTLMNIQCGYALWRGNNELILTTVAPSRGRCYFVEPLQRLGAPAKCFQNSDSSFDQN